MHTMYIMYNIISQKPNSTADSHAGAIDTEQEQKLRSKGHRISIAEFASWKRR